jgi:hypothetical protein
MCGWLCKRRPKVDIEETDHCHQEDDETRTRESNEERQSMRSELERHRQVLEALQTEADSFLIRRRRNGAH